MAKWCLNYESEDIEEDGYSVDKGEYVYNWDNNKYKRKLEEEEKEERRIHDEEEDW